MLDYHVTVLASPSAVPPPPPFSALRFSGITVLTYVEHHVDRNELRDAVARGALRPLTGPDSYAEKVSADAGLVYSAPLPAGRIDDGLPGTVGAIEQIDLQQSVLWLGDDHALSIFPLTLATEDVDIAPGGRLARPVTTQDVLDFINLLKSEAVARSVVDNAEQTLRRIGLSLDGPSRMLGDRLGLMIWNLDGSSERDRAAPFHGARESANYAWELSALLAHNVDHMREPGLWQRQNPEQVYAAIESGYCFLDDHMVFTNSTCCLEIAHLPGWFRERSRRRLDLYGYDSSSLFVWNIAMLRAASLRGIARSYERQLGQLSRREELTPEEHKAALRACLGDEEYVSRVDRYGDYLREPRNRAYGDLVDRALGTARLAVVAERQIARVTVAMERLARAAGERKFNSRSLGLAGVATVLAAVGIPEMVSSFEGWIAAHAWTPLGTAVALMAAILVGVPTWLKLRNK